MINFFLEEGKTFVETKFIIFDSFYIKAVEDFNTNPIFETEIEIIMKCKNISL